jgi:hypothetical protein
MKQWTERAFSDPYHSSNSGHLPSDVSQGLHQAGEPMLYEENFNIDPWGDRLFAVNE